MKSRLHLPKLDSAPRTILEYLIAHFHRITAETWHERILNGKVALDDGTTLTLNTPYRHGKTVLYTKEVAQEPSACEEEAILYQDANILIADKPHGMVVTPSGDHVKRSLLIRLQSRTGLTTLAPIHRLDRETAGVVLFTIQPQARGRYHQLFSTRTVGREYLAVAHLDGVPDRKEWILQNRMEAAEPWYRRRIAADCGAVPNAITRIDLLETRKGLGLFRLRPETGKKHQLRVHMASIGFPIIGDLLYPDIREKTERDPPLQLLAHRLTFIDPLSGEPRTFSSARKLLWPVE